MIFLDGVFFPGCLFHRYISVCYVDGIGGTRCDVRWGGRGDIVFYNAEVVRTA
jgi:hypothetical protein